MVRVEIKNVGNVTKKAILQEVYKKFSGTSHTADWNHVFGFAVSAQTKEVSKNKFDIEIYSNNYDQKILEDFIQNIGF